MQEAGDGGIESVVADAPVRGAGCKDRRRQNVGER